MITLCEANLWKKNPYLAMLKNLFFQILATGPAGGLLPKFNQFFLVHRYMFGKIFLYTKIRSVVFTYHTDRQTDKRRALHKLLGGGN